MLLYIEKNIQVVSGATPEIGSPLQQDLTHMLIHDQILACTVGVGEIVPI